MISSGAKKLAASYGLKTAQGMTFGEVLGYATTLTEDAGCQILTISTRLMESQKVILRSRLAERALGSEYCLEELRLSDDRITVLFLTRPGTAKKIQAFIQWFYPCLDEVQADKAVQCSVCHRAVGTEGVWKLNGGMARRVHPECGLREETWDGKPAYPVEMEDGSYIRGLLGAVLGAVLGAIVWAFVLSIGYVTCVVGLLIGWLSVKGYQKLGGSAGSKKPLLIGLAVLFGILLGTAAGESLAVGQMITHGAIPGAALSDIPLLIYYLLSEQPGYLGDLLGNMGLGLLFGLLLVFFLLRSEARERPVPEE